MTDRTIAALREENDDIRGRLQESEEILQALRAGDVDAITVQTSAGLGVFSRTSAEQPYREMVETMSEGAATIGADGLIIYCNQRFADMLRVDLNAIMGTSLVAHFAAHDRTPITTALDKSLGEVTRITADLLSVGASVPVTIAIRVHACNRFLLIVSDLTEITAAQDEVTKKSNLLNSILQSAIKYAIIGATTDHNILFWNEGACRIYGYTADEVIGRPLDILFAADCGDLAVFKQLHETAHRRGIAEGPFECIREDGTRFPAHLVLTRRDDIAGNPIGYLLMSNDISDQRRAEDELRSVSQYARNLIEACLDPLITISPDGIITDINHATELITGHARERLIGSDFAIYFTEPEKARAGYQRVFAKGFLIDNRLAIRHVSRTVTEVLCNASLYHDTRGEVAGVFLVARDISRMLPADLMPPPRRRVWSWGHAAIIAAGLLIVAAATVLPTLSRPSAQQPASHYQFLQMTATSARMQALLREISPAPARVQAARIQRLSKNNDFGYTITYAVAAPDHDPGVLGKEQLLSRFADGMAVLSAGNCFQPAPTSQPSDTGLIVCPISGKAGLIGLLLASWDQGDPVPGSYDAEFAALKRAGSDIAAIWSDQ